MMFRKNWMVQVVWGALLPCLCAGCVREVTMDAEEAPQVVVDCVLSDAPAQNLYLLYTKGASRSQAPALNEAVAVLTDLTENREAGQFTRVSDGSWQLDYAAIPAHRYRLDVSIPGHDPIRAEQTMPSAPDIRVRWNGGWRENTPEQYKDDYGYLFTVSSLKDPVWFYGVGYPAQELEDGPATLLCTDFPGVDPFNKTETFYFPSSEQGFWKSDWFRFSTYPDLTGMPMYRRYLRFPAQENLPETDFLVSGALQGSIDDIRDFVHAQKHPARLYYFSASEDYDRFLRESYQLLEARSSDNLTDFFLRTNVFSNIQGAIGLFGAKMECMKEWDGDECYGNNGSFLLPGIASPEEFVDELNDPRYYTTQDPPYYITQEPFRLLHYELQVSTIPPFWAPPPNGVAGTGEASYIIRDDAQLYSHGLEDVGPVDFSNKVVLLFVRRDQRKSLPIYLQYARYEKTPEALSASDNDADYDRYFPSVQYLLNSNLTEQIYSSRLAILVDGNRECFEDPRFSPRWRTYFQLSDKNGASTVLDQAIETLSGQKQKP